jgi:3-deoxy-D-manno-octulosonic-acid transferase
VSLLLYNLFIVFYRWALLLAARWNPKAKKWVEGRKAWEHALIRFRKQDQRPLVWMHCASLGEFEQGRPILEWIRANYPNHSILLSFFSPSGYEIRKNYAGADYVCYLPMDSARNARKFIETANPSLVIWVRYEFWYHYLNILSGKNIPVVLIAGRFRESQPFFRSYGRLHRHMLTCFRHLFLQDDASAELLSKVGIHKTTVAGDTRYDRVSAIAEKFEPIPEIERFVGNHPVVVCGSTWPEDEEELDHFANTRPDIRFIIAPHEIYEEHLRDMEKLFQHTIRFSIWKQAPDVGTTANVLIIDNIGMLSRLYKYATLAYVGGGFGDDGLHNILEAAVYGVPVIHGPVYDRFPEATELIEAGGGFAVSTALELENRFHQLLTDEKTLAAASQSAATFVANRRGASAFIQNYLEENLLLTS